MTNSCLFSSPVLRPELDCLGFRGLCSSRECESGEHGYEYQVHLAIAPSEYKRLFSRFDDMNQVFYDLVISYLSDYPNHEHKSKHYDEFATYCIGFEQNGEYINDYVLAVSVEDALSHFRVKYKGHPKDVFFTLSLSKSFCSDVTDFARAIINRN